MRKLVFALTVTLGAGLVNGQLLDSKKLLQQPTDTWPTYNGDYSARRYSTLKQINSANVHTLSLAWVQRYGSGAGIAIKSTPLLVNGVLYFTSPNHV
jgi:alcohol dehydrogenase (cytochrome c)